MKVIIIGFMLIFLYGCTSVLPSDNVRNGTGISTFQSIKSKYDGIVLDYTPMETMVQMGFDPYNTTNVEILSYTDIIVKFMPSDNILISDLPIGIQKCLAVREQCFSFNVTYTESDTNHIGNATLDVLGFVEEVEVKGWHFSAIFIMVDDVVVYKLFKGNPKEYQYIKKTRPLGPLQKIGNNLLENSI